MAASRPHTSRVFGAASFAVVALVLGMATVAWPPKWVGDPKVSWQSLLQPFYQGAPLPGDFRIQRIERGPENDVVIATSRERDHSSVEIHVLPRTRWGGVRESRSFAIAFEIPHSPAPEPDRQAVTEAVAEVLRARDYGLPVPDAIPLGPAADPTVLPWWLENLRGTHGVLLGWSLSWIAALALTANRKLAFACVGLALFDVLARNIALPVDQTGIPLAWSVPGAAWLLLNFRRGVRVRNPDLIALSGVFAIALVLRLGLGSWGPLRINGIGPLWVQGAARDPAAIAAYGPGYVEIFGWTAALARSQPDWAIFSCNVMISAGIPVLAFVLGRLLGIARRPALAAALLLAIDPVNIRMAATESYFPPIICLCATASVALAGAIRKRERAIYGIVAAALLLLQAVRIHPSAWGPAMAVPFVILAVPGQRLGQRVAFFFAAAPMISGMIIFASSGVLLDVLGHARNGVLMQPPAPATNFLLWIAAATSLYALIGRHRGLVFAASVPFALMMMSRHAYGQSWLWQQSYDRLYLTLPLVAFVGLVLARRQRAFEALVATLVVVLWLIFAREIITGRTTDHLEYRWLREQLAHLPPDCHVIHLASAGKRGMYLPTYVGPPRTARIMEDREAHTIEEALIPAPCVYYVHTSLCSSVEGRSLCDTIEQRLGLTVVARATFPARPSNDGLPYDRDSIETFVARIHRFDGQPAP